MEGLSNGFIAVFVRISVFKFNAVPWHEGVVSLDPDARIGAYLCLQYPRCRPCSLSEGTCSFLEQVKRVQSLQGHDDDFLSPILTPFLDFVKSMHENARIEHDQVSILRLPLVFMCFVPWPFGIVSPGDLFSSGWRTLFRRMSCWSTFVNSHPDTGGALSEWLASIPFPINVPVSILRNIFSSRQMGMALV